MQPDLARIEKLVIAGWAGRDQDEVQKHIAELEEIGVKPPSTTPLFYVVGPKLLTTDSVIEVLGDQSSGEVEALLVSDGETRWIGIGSDHTDRKLEAVSVAASKQICPKPVGPEFWPYDEVHDHIEKLELRSSIVEDGKTVGYQQGTMAQLIPPFELAARSGLADGAGAFAMFCGTVPVVGGVRPSKSMTVELVDPVLGRTLSHTYSVDSLPEIA